MLWWEVSDDELSKWHRLVVSAEIAKIHTIEWTTQLLYNEPLNRGMNAELERFVRGLSTRDLRTEGGRGKPSKSQASAKANQWYSAFTGGPGIFGLGNQIKQCRLAFLF